MKKRIAMIIVIANIMLLLSCQEAEDNNTIGSSKSENPGSDVKESRLKQDGYLSKSGKMLTINNIDFPFKSMNEVKKAYPEYLSIRKLDISAIPEGFSLDGIDFFTNLDYLELRTKEINSTFIKELEKCKLVNTVVIFNDGNIEEYPDWKNLTNLSTLRINDIKSLENIKYFLPQFNDLQFTYDRNVISTEEITKFEDYLRSNQDSIGIMAMPSDIEYEHEPE